MRSEMKKGGARDADATVVGDTPKPAPDAPREEWLRWHLSRRPPRSRQHYETLARILDGVRQSA